MPAGDSAGAEARRRFALACRQGIDESTRPAASSASATCSSTSPATAPGSRRHRIVTGLAERGGGVRAVDRERPAAGRALVMTMHRAKGTEFSKVVLAGVGAQTPGEQARLAAMDEAERADAELRERSLVYVAATRARDELVVVRRA